ncbi:MAG: glycosyltransferase [Candidatus Hydrogenedentes bacterium]|nr:glycosyltransferase [Candidatus Hydrogenedentota bacterium]
MRDQIEQGQLNDFDDLGSLYDDEYYRTGCGIPYERNEHWIKFCGGVADEIVRSLRPRRVLDAGCAWGFLVESLWDRGVEAWGVDISPYAISKVRPDMKNYCSVGSLTEPINGVYDLITCIEVLEHMPEDQARKAVERLTSATDVILFSSTPKDFDEPTHFNVKPIIYWLKLFAEFNFWPDLLYDASFLTAHAILFRSQSQPVSEEVLTLFSERLRHAMAVTDRDTEIAELHRQVGERDAAIADREAQIAEQEARIAKRDALIGERDDKILRLAHDMERSQTELEHRAQALEAVYASTSWRLTAPLRKTKTMVRWLAALVRRRRPIHMRLEAVDQAESLEDTPRFILKPDQERHPTGWALLTCKSGMNAPIPHLILYARDGRELVRQASVPLRSSADGSIRRLLRLPDQVDELCVDTMGPADALPLSDVAFTEVGKLEAAVRLGWNRIRPSLGSPLDLARLAVRGLGVLRSEGLGGVKSALLGRQSAQHDEDRYAHWIERYDTLTEADRDGIRSRIAAMAETPVICVVMPVYNPPVHFLRAAIESVCSQLYPYWELCIADDASTDAEVRGVLDEYRARDDRIKVVYRTENGHISAASNSALELATGQFVALLDHDDVLAEHALYMIAETVNKDPDAALIYSDEDKVDAEGKRYEPYFKSDWNPELTLSQNMISHLGVYRREIVERIGGFRIGFEGSQDYDLALRVIEQTEPGHIHHVPHVLYHWRAIPGSVALSQDEKAYPHARARQAIKEHLARRGIAADVVASRSGAYHRVRYALPDPLPRVSLIVPTRDKVELLSVCIDGVLNGTDYSDLEVIVVDNQSSDPDALAYFRHIKQDPRVRVLRYERPFNFSAINNFAVDHANGTLIGLLNNDLEVIEPSWLKEMVSHAVRPDVGAVGAMLYYPDDTIQHAGVALGLGGVAGHLHYRWPRGTPGYFGRAELVQNCSAVTAACMVMRAEVFREVGGLDADNLPVAFNDIDLCIRIRERGYSIVWTPFAELYHHESASRGSDAAPNASVRFAREVQYMRRRWDAVLEDDPFYNPNLSLSPEDGSFALAVKPRVDKPWKSSEQAGSGKSLLER